jgi:hypothetical protein
MAFGITWPIIMIGQFQGLNFDFPFWFWVIVVTVSPAQGISNAYCYFRPLILKRRRRGRRLAEHSTDDEELRNQESGFATLQRNCFLVYCGLCSTKRPTGGMAPSDEDVGPTDELANLRSIERVQRRTVEDDVLEVVEEDESSNSHEPLSKEESPGVIK